MDKLRLALTCFLVSVIIITSIAIVSIELHPTQRWFSSITQEEFDGLTEEEQLELIVMQFNYSKNIFNPESPTIKNLSFLISQNVNMSNIPETFTKYVCDNIHYKTLESNIYYKCDDPAVKVLENGEASCLGMSILLSNLLMSYNDSIPVYLYFGSYLDQNHVVTVCIINDTTWYALDPGYYYEIGFLQTTSHSYLLSELDRYSTFYYSLSASGIKALK